MSDRFVAGLCSRVRLWHVLALVAFTIGTSVAGAFAADWPVFFPPDAAFASVCDFDWLERAIMSPRADLVPVIGKTSIAFYAQRLSVPDGFTNPWFLALPSILLMLYVAIADSEPLNWLLGIVSALSLLTLFIGFSRQVGLVTDNAGLGFEIFARRDRLESIESEATYLSQATSARAFIFGRSVQDRRSNAS